MGQALKGQLELVAQELTDLWVNEINRQDLIDTGNLINTIEWTVEESATGYIFKLYYNTDSFIKNGKEHNKNEEDYFKYVDGRFHVSRNVRTSPGFQSLMGKIARMYALDALSTLTSDLNTQGY